MDDAWYYASGQEQKGPLTADQMSALYKSGTLSGDTLVWMQQLPGWAPLKDTSLATLLSRSSSGFPPQPPPSIGRAPIPTGAGTAVFNQAVSGSDNEFIRAVKTCFSKFVTWRGRAARPEFWYFFLFCFGISIVCSIFDGIIFGRGHLGAFGAIANLAFLLPSLAAGVRRLHDTDRSAWWLLLNLVPLVGFIVVIVFYCQRGTPGPNRYGASPDSGSVAEVF